ncbi:MAG: S-methyl-5-thioribose-1-phosphate isomerase [Methanospirillum sp.]|nr:S-methyl-5-thioribose-1-phosphate isomerase [Methanospirillum sp.]
MQPLRPVLFHPDVPEIAFIEQTLLPGTLETRSARTIQELADAIRRLGIRGAPALGCAGACGIALSALITRESDLTKFISAVRHDADLLRSTRPTAVNLFYGIDRVMAVVESAGSVKDAQVRAVREAEAVVDSDRQTCHAIGNHGLQIVPHGARILTHCNAGALACGEWGTALGVVRSAHEAGRDIRVYACETRPLLQGARLTSWELERDGIDVTLITDSMAAVLMRKGEIDLVIVGADRVVSDAVFNKIGTYMHAVCAHAHQIPFYIAAPFSTFDEDAKEEMVPIEERAGDEIRMIQNCSIAPRDIKVWNPAFDATPMNLVTGIITEHGIFRLPRDIDLIKEKKKSSGREGFPA